MTDNLIPDQDGSPRRRGRPPSKPVDETRGSQRAVEQRADQRPFIPRMPENRLEIDASRLLPHMDYLWGVVAVKGDTSEASREMANRRYNKWEPVPAYMHPEVSGIDDPKAPGANEAIVLGGLRFEWRNRKYSDVVRQIDDQKAAEQVGSQLDRMKHGEDGGVRKFVKKFEREFVPLDKG